MNTSCNSLMLIISLVLILLSISLFRSYQKFKLIESNKLQHLINEMSTEKKIFKNLERKKFEVNQIKSKIDCQFLKIKTLLFNLDFSLSEIL